jgi:tRNA pseudouridine38-40 synthase
MRNIRLKIEYDGTAYNGWQIQSKHTRNTKPPKTIQHELEKALSRILQEQVKIIGSGRTDAGVHALGQVANFKTKSNMPSKNIQRALNGILPDDIVIIGSREVPLDFHARFDAVSKTYSYQILNRPIACAKNRFYQYHIGYKLDYASMQNAADMLLGKKDFRSFQAKDKKNRRSIKEIKRISVKKRGSNIRIDIQADGFLYNMVRNIVGTLIEVGRGRIKPIALKAILQAKDRTKAGPTAPARGLCLVSVKYR